MKNKLTHINQYSNTTKSVKLTLHNQTNPELTVYQQRINKILEEKKH